MKDLFCPKCHKKLSTTKKTARCKDCDFNVVKKGDIWDAVGKSYYWGEIPQREMEETNEIAKKDGYKAAITDVILKNPSLRENLTMYLVSKSRIDWLFHCLNLKSSDRCLDIGSGWGSTAFPLSKYYKET